MSKAPQDSAPSDPPNERSPRGLRSEQAGDFGDPPPVAPGLAPSAPGAEEQLREALDLQQRMVDASPIGILAYSADGQCVAANEAAARIVGAPPGKLTTLNFRHIPSWKASGLLDHAEQSLRSGETRSTDIHMVTSFGREVWLSCQLTPFLRGARPHLLVQVSDVTPRRRIEQALRESETRFRTIVETAIEGVATLDAGLRIDYCNRRFADMLGYAPEEMLGRDPIELVHEDDRAAVVERLSARRTGQQETYELRYRHKGGQVVHVLLSANPLFDAEGRFSGVCAMVTDITERKRAQQALERSEKNLARAQHLGRVGSWARDLRTNVIHASEECCRLLGLESPFPFARLLDAIHPDDRERMRETVQYAVSSRSPYRAEYRVVRPDGGEVAMHAAGEVVCDAGGNPIELVGTVQDVTEWKRQERQVSELLQREQIARLDAELANQAKDAFLATLSHELRTPLTPILAWAQMLQAGHLAADDAKKAGEAIERSVRVQAKLIDDLLDISRIVAGKLSVEVQPLRPQDIVARVVESLAGAAAQKNIRIATELDPAVETVFADPARLQQVLWNLLGNAVKFTPDGGRIEVVLRSKGESAEIAVSDDGIGIAPAFLTSIFERFSQEDTSSKRRHGGLGLGLAIASNLVGRMGGTIRAESPGRGRGATFTVTLPTTSAPAPAHRSGLSGASTTAPLGQEDLERIRRSRVLLVDDDEEALAALARVLDELEVSVRTATSARAALAAVGDFRPHVIVSDLAMPGEDGYDLIRKLRQLPPDEGGATPAVALTAFAGQDDMKRATAAGFQGYLSKPVDANRLLFTIIAFAAER